MSERESAGRLLGLPCIFQRDDGLYQIGLANDDAGGPFPTRAFAESVAMATPIGIDVNTSKTTHAGTAGQ